MSKTAKEHEKKQNAYQDQTQKAAMFMLNKLVSQFYEVFMENDPEDQIVTNKRKQIVAKWKMYCHQKKLVLEVAIPMADEACKSIVDKYNEHMKEEMIDGYKEVLTDAVTKFDLSGELSDKPIEVLK
jgi:hypothetical protein